MRPFLINTGRFIFNYMAASPQSNSGQPTEFKIKTTIQIAVKKTPQIQRK